MKDHEGNSTDTYATPPTPPKKKKKYPYGI